MTKKELKPKVAIISAELAHQLLGILEAIVEHDTYETEYDGKSMTMCHDCGWLETGWHDPDCMFIKAEKLITEAYTSKELK